MMCLLTITSVKAGIYKWVDKDGVTQFTDQPIQQNRKGAVKINVDSSGSSIGNSESHKRERSAMRAIDRREYKRKYNSHQKTRDNGASNKNKREDASCKYAKKQVADHHKMMRKGYSAGSSNYNRDKKRRLTESAQSACRN